MAANGTWWLRDDEGGFVLHRTGEHIFDWTVPAARQAWLGTAANALAEGSVDGIFVDKASHATSFHGVRRGRMRAWMDGHDALLVSLRSSTAKLVLLNNAHAAPAAAGGAGMGQLFERWGELDDHDELDLADDMKLLGELQTDGLITLARAGGVTPGSSPSANAAACGSGLAAFLIAQKAPELGFFSCEPDFRSSVDPTQPTWNQSSGWMTILEGVEYSAALGAPLGGAEVTDGLTTRSFAGGMFDRNHPEFGSGPAFAMLNASGSGCVQWPEGHVSGQCPLPEGRKPCCTKCSAMCDLRKCSKIELERSQVCATTLGILQLM